MAKGLHRTHGSSPDLTLQAVQDGIVPALSARTVRRILHAVDWQPPRTRYGKTSRLDAQFKRRAEPVLWCYGNAHRWVEPGLWVVCVDEMPNGQVLERHPLRRAVPGFIEHQEFEYQRHGTVTILGFLIVHTGGMEAVILDRKDALHYIQALERFRQQHPALQGVFLIPEGDPSPTAHTTQAYLTEQAHLVACSIYPGARLLAEAGGNPDSRVSASVLDTRVLDHTRRVY